MTEQNDDNKDPAEDPGDPAVLARRFVDLWQAQLSALANDPASAKAVQDAMTLWQKAVPIPGQTPNAADPPGVQDMVAFWQNMAKTAGTAAATMTRTTQEGASDVTSTAAPSSPDKFSQEGPNPNGQNPSGAETTAGPSDGGDKLLHELDRRFTQLEERLDRLESGPETRSGPAVGKSGAQKSTAKRKSSNRKKPAKSPS